MLTPEERLRLVRVLSDHYRYTDFALKIDRDQNRIILEWSGRPVVSKVQELLDNHNLWGTGAVNALNWSNGAELGL